VSRGTLDYSFRFLLVSYTGLLPSSVDLPRSILLPISIYFVAVSSTPSFLSSARFGLFPFRSPLLGESIFLSFPQGT